MIEHPVFDKLITAMGRVTVIELADLAPSDPTLIPALIDASKYPKPKNRARKASWVLHHISDRHPELIQPYLVELLDILDESEDTSVYREILKIYTEVKLSKSQLQALREPLYELGVGMLYDDSLQKGLHYISMRLIQIYAESNEEKQEGVEAISQLIARCSAEDKSMCNAAKRTLERLKKSIS